MFFFNLIFNCKVFKLQQCGSITLNVSPKTPNLSEEIENNFKKNPNLASHFLKASALWVDAFYKSICPSVCLSVCLSVYLSVCSLLRYRLNVFLPPLSHVGCPIFLEIRNPQGKIVERSGLRLENFCLKIV